MKGAGDFGSDLGFGVCNFVVSYAYNHKIGDFGIELILAL